MDDTQLLTVKATAKALGVSERIVREEIRDGHLAAYTVRGTYRISKKEIAAYLRRNRVVPTNNKDLVEI